MKIISEDRRQDIAFAAHPFIFQNLSNASEAEARFSQQTVSNCYKLTAVSEEIFY